MLIQEDSDRRPELFHWFGPIPRLTLLDFAREIGARPPPELLVLWERKGGVDLFESETILSPAAPSRVDDVLDVTAFQVERGFPSDYFVVHLGLEVLTAFRVGEVAYEVFHRDDFRPLRTYTTIDRWYAFEIRRLYAEGYKLGELPPMI